MIQKQPKNKQLNTHKSHKPAELSLVIPVIGICLLMSPLVNAFTKSSNADNILLSLTYVFGVWGFLILSAFIISRLLITEISED